MSPARPLSVAGIRPARWMTARAARSGSAAPSSVAAVARAMCVYACGKLPSELVSRWRQPLNVHVGVRVVERSALGRASSPCSFERSIDTNDAQATPGTASKDRNHSYLTLRA